MKILKITILFLVIIFIINACHKDFEEISKTTSPVPSPSVLEEEPGDILGYVFDENNNPVSGADVTIYSGSTTTDSYGIFRFKNINLDKHGTYLKVQKTGYFMGSDYIFPTGGTNFSYVHLYSQTNTGSFLATEGGVINAQGGGTVTFSPNSIIKDDGTVYSGTVNVTAKMLSANDKKLGSKMPGSFMATDIDGYTKVLATYGMMLVELRDEAGNKLNLKSGTTAELVFPLPGNLINDAPGEIPLWYFDEDKGLWIEEGKATLSDGKYTGEVSHFSWWNIDAKFPTIQLCVSVLFESGAPAVGYELFITFNSNPGSSGWTDKQGYECGKVPKGEVLTIWIRNPICEEFLTSIEVGPFENDVILEDIVIPDFHLGAGQVVCDGENFSDAQVILQYNYTDASDHTLDGTLLIASDSDGYFKLPYSDALCFLMNSAKVFAYNIATEEGSNTEILDFANPNDTIVLDVCNDCSFTVTINQLFLGECTSLEATVSDADSYEFLWSDGQTTPLINGINSGVYCVTVTNTEANCNAIQCFDVPVTSNININILDLANPNCALNNGIINFEITGGSEPYDLHVTGPNGFSSTNTNLNNLEEGTYLIEITDAIGCTFSSELFLTNDNSSFGLEIYAEYLCNGGATLIASASFPASFDPIYSWSNGDIGEIISITESGYYCVTITDNISGCELNTCQDILIQDYLDPPIPIGCDANIYSFLNSDNVSVTTQTGNYYPATGGEDTLFINVLVDGFWFISEEMCPLNYSIPSFQGSFYANHINTSCSTCNDGSIVIYIDTNGPCYECTYGNIAIYAIDDLTVDLTPENDAQSLSAGDYYVVILDAFTNCILGFTIVTIG